MKQKETIIFQSLNIPKDLPNSPKIFPLGGLGTRVNTRCSFSRASLSIGSVSIWGFWSWHPQNTHESSLALSRKVKHFKRLINGIKSFQLIWVLVTQLLLSFLRIIGRWMDMYAYSWLSVSAEFSLNFFRALNPICHNTRIKSLHFSILFSVDYAFHKIYWLLSTEGS